MRTKVNVNEQSPSWVNVKVGIRQGFILLQLPVLDRFSYYIIHLAA